MSKRDENCIPRRARAPQRTRARGAPLGTDRHAVYRLADDLLLVFKPSGHGEPEHAHEYGQRLRLLRGRLEVATARAVRILDERRAALFLPAGCKHRTTALADTWLVAEKVFAGTAAPSAARGRAAGNRHGLRVAPRAQHRSR
jgi:hypothetical protein